MLKLIEKIMDKCLLSNKHFQDYINARFDDGGQRFIITTGYFEYGYRAGKKFMIDSTICDINDDFNDYRVDDIRKTDHVLDIGALSGAFSIRIADMVRHCYAVEPLSTETVNQNIMLNNINNITVLEYGLGNGDTQLKYGHRTKLVKCLSLSELIVLCGGHIDFLKCDCEGGEWSIQPEELQGIRRVEMEVHHFQDMPRLSVFEDILKKEGFDYIKEINGNETMLIHATRDA